MNTKFWDISTIFVPGDFRTPTQPNTLVNAESLNWEIYGNNGVVPDGDPSGRGNPPLWSLSLPPGDRQVSLTTGTSGYHSNVTLNLDRPVRLNPNTYWLVFYPKMHPDDDGVYGRQPSGAVNTSLVAKVVQPGGAENYPTEWTAVLSVAWPPAVFPIELTGDNFAFRIEGTIIDSNIVVTPAAINFGNVLFGQTSVVQTVTISNTGTSDLSISTMNITGTNSSEFQHGNWWDLWNNFSNKPCRISELYSERDLRTHVSGSQIGKRWPSPPTTVIPRLLTWL